MDGPFSLREKVRMRGSIKLLPYFLFSSPQPSPAGEGALLHSHAGAWECYKKRLFNSIRQFVMAAFHAGTPLPLS
jgi:hypothetical protein